LKSCCQLILDVRTSAHISLDRLRPRPTVCLCFWFHQKPKAVQTVKLTLHHRVAPSSAIYVQLFVHRMNQTAHISLQISSMSKNVGAKTPETKSTNCALTYGAARIIHPEFFPVRSSRAPLRRPVPCPSSASAPPVKGVLRLVPDTRNPFFAQLFDFP